MLLLPYILAGGTGWR